MSISSDTLRRLAALNLAPEAMGEVLSIIADILDTGAARRETLERSRKADRLDVTQAEWLWLRSEILRRDNRRCRYCGGDANSVDHILPLARGGISVADNLVAACIPCNSSKCDKLLSEWRGGVHAS